MATRKAFQLECPSWLENIYIFSAGNNFPCNNDFYGFKISDGSFSVLIFKGPIHSFWPIWIFFFACSCFCLKEVWMNLIHIQIICASTLATIICRVGDKFIHRSFYEFFHWGNIKCHKIHWNISQFILFIQSLYILQILSRQMWGSCIYMLWTNRKSIPSFQEQPYYPFWQIKNGIALKSITIMSRPH